MSEKTEYKMYPYPENFIRYAGLQDCLPLTEERRKSLEYVLSKMPPRRAEAIRLYFQENMTQIQVGRLLGVNGSRVGYLLREAARILRRQENRECINLGYSAYMAKLQKKEAEAVKQKAFPINHPEAIRIRDAGFAGAAERAFTDAGFAGAAERAFTDAGLRTVGEVTQLIEQENYYLCFRSYGPAADRKVRRRLAELGLKL